MNHISTSKTGQCAKESDEVNIDNFQATSTNRGVNLENHEDLSLAKFDYYRFSLPAGLEMKIVRDLIAPIVGQLKILTKKYVEVGYDFCDEINIPGQGSLQIFYGGRNYYDYGVNICAKGYISQQVATLVQSSSHQFKLSRADVCQDFLGDYSVARSLIARICDQSRINVYDKGACSASTRTEGKTVQGGSDKSFYQVVCYEKGIQLGEGLPKDYLRLEHRFRPKSEQKVAFGKLSAIDMLGTHRACRTLSERILDTQIEPFNVFVPSKDKDAFSHLIKQYGKTLNAFFNEHGACKGGEMLAFQVNPHHKWLH